jgi:Na+-driven multidrug efflux pump
LGNKDFDEAYKIGKNSLYATLVIWVVYFVLSAAFVIPITSGMNVNLQGTSILAMFIYIFIHLFRFISWNLTTYIICCGGVMKYLFWQEVVSTSYFILIYFLAPLIPANLFLVYFLITIPYIVICVICFIIFKRKKWMQSVSNDASLMEIIEEVNRQQDSSIEM